MPRGLGFYVCTFGYYIHLDFVTAVLHSPFLFFSIGDSSKTDIIIRGKCVGSVPDVRFYKCACLGECADLADKLAYFECTEKVVFIIEVHFYPSTAHLNINMIYNPIHDLLYPHNEVRWIYWNHKVCPSDCLLFVALRHGYQSLNYCIRSVS